MKSLNSVRSLAAALAMSWAGAVPGLSIAFVYKDEVIYLEGFGVREVGNSAPVDADTVFQIASLSKPLASTVVAATVSDGIVSFDSRMADIEPAMAWAANAYGGCRAGAAALDLCRNLWQHLILAK